MSGSRATFVGFALAVLLTVIPFGVVSGGFLPRHAALWLIGLCAIAQIIVHLHFFLGVRLDPGYRGKIGSLLFAAVVMFIMIGGTIWVMGNLNWRMMY